MLATPLSIAACFALAAWLWLLLARGGFWLCNVRDSASAPPPASWPEVVALVPARDEASLIAATLGSVLSQRYPGKLSAILIDDQSADGTAPAALAAARAAGAGERLSILPGTPPPPGWTGKLWALQQGLDRADRDRPQAAHIWLADADIAFSPDTLAHLVARAEEGGLALASLMARLRCEGLAERCLIPAFVFYFQMLYPFAWVNRPGNATAAAAGGCMLVRRSALRAIGGLHAVRGALIDDCALGRRLKQQGPVSLCLTGRAVSLRAGGTFGDIRRMVARSAYAQLDNSPLLLAGAVAAMLAIHVAPPVVALVAPAPAAWIGLAAWAAMAVAFVPTLVFYGLNPVWGLALPLIALAYVAFTVDSALQHWRGQGGAWKGRFQAQPLVPR